ncbi:MAG TPA: hypothetical protein VG013_06525, partial [Gemmataceae bacterium]|nr:hypothetical protein [Gemmataceae bacterium]
MVKLFWKKALVSRDRMSRPMRRSMCPKQICGSMLHASVRQTDAISQSDLPTAKPRESEPDSSASSWLRIRHLPSSCVAMSVSRTSLMRRI